jgi:hypothetical protein
MNLPALFRRLFGRRARLTWTQQANLAHTRTAAWCRVELQYETDPAVRVRLQQTLDDAEWAAARTYPAASQPATV